MIRNIFGTISDGLVSLSEAMRTFSFFPPPCRYEDRFYRRYLKDRPKTLEEAWRRDWENIGGDFRRACARFEREHGLSEGAQWSGVLPPPSVLEAYQRHSPKAVDIILDMAREEQSARHVRERNEIELVRTTVEDRPLKEGTQRAIMRQVGLTPADLM